MYAGVTTNIGMTRSANAAEQHTPSGPAQRFCDNRCRLGERPCAECGKNVIDTVPQSGRSTRRFCSNEHRWAWQAKHSAYRWYDANGYVHLLPSQSRVVSPDGYVRVNVGPDRSTRTDRRILEHRFVMEQLLGRP